MDIALAVPLADNWGMHGSGGWWIVAVVPMMLFMGAMMWMMMRGMGDSSHGSSAPGGTSVAGETPLQMLERRLAEGEISIEEYRARRDALVGDSDDEQHRRSQEAM